MILGGESDDAALDITNSTFRSTLYRVLLHIFMHSVPKFQQHPAIFDKVIGILSWTHFEGDSFMTPMTSPNINELPPLR